MSALPPFAPGVYTGEGAATRLTGSRCPASGRTYFPRLDLCPDDGTPAEDIALSPDGILYSATVVRMKPPFGLPQPYAVGYVDLPAHGLRIFALLDPARIGDYRIGMKLVLTSGPLGTDLAGQPCARPFFTPAEG